MAKPSSKKTPPWKQKNPAVGKGKSNKLTPAEKAEAARRAKSAGRPYPNLVDNMSVASKSKRSKSKDARS